MTREHVVERPATAHGWLRRKELDEPYCDVWEAPDGKLFALKKGELPILMTFRWPDVCIDP